MIYPEKAAKIKPKTKANLKGAYLDYDTRMIL